MRDFDPDGWKGVTPWRAERARILFSSPVAVPGIGRAAAVSLHHAGLRVYATARRLDTLADLASRGMATMALDVTDEASMTAAVAAVEADAGVVGTLINNAG